MTGVQTCALPILCVCVSARVCVSMCPCGSALLACVRVQDDVPVSGLCVCALCGVYVCAPMWQRRMQRVFLQSPGRAVRQASHLSLLLLFSLHRTNSFPSSWAQIHLIHSFIPENISVIWAPKVLGYKIGRASCRERVSSPV